jgi:RNA polymerase sigma-70 factor (ECF subfamily)
MTSSQDSRAVPRISLPFIAYLPDLRRFISHFHLPAPDAEDVLQEVATRAWQASARFAGRSAPKTYLLGVAKNVLRERRRDKARAAAIDDHAYLLVRPQVVEPDDDAGTGEADPAALRPAVSLLPSKLRVAVELFYFRGMPIAQAAAIAGCSPSAFRVRLARARQCLQTLLSHGGAPAFVVACQLLHWTQQ